jgi:alkylation response protein AidB-like acyl-CoA dehydrogenase
LNSYIHWEKCSNRRLLPFVYDAARRKGAQLEFRKEAAMCKYFASHLGERVASLAVEILRRFSCNDAPFRTEFKVAFSRDEKSHLAIVPWSAPAGDPL